MLEGAGAEPLGGEVEDSCSQQSAGCTPPRSKGGGEPTQPPFPVREDTPLSRGRVSKGGQGQERHSRGVPSAGMDGLDRLLPDS